MIDYIDDHDVRCRVVEYCDEPGCGCADTSGVIVYSGGSLSEMQSAVENSRYADCRVEVTFPLFCYAGVLDGQHRFPLTGETVRFAMAASDVSRLVDVCRLDYRVGNHLRNAVESDGKRIRMTMGDDADIVNLQAIEQYRNLARLVTVS